MIAIIDYGMGNLRSIQYKLQKAGIKAVVAAKPEEIEKATRLILPGVGHFASGMNNLSKSKLIPVLNKKVLQDKTPIMGICLGMQLFTTGSEEGNVEGLGWLNAETRLFNFTGTDYAHLRVPHVGWNTIASTQQSDLLSGVLPEQRFYFTHSYYVHSNSEAEILAVTSYGHPFVSVVRKENIFGVQFHPEKSHKRGIEIIKNFVRYM